MPGVEAPMGPPPAQEHVMSTTSGHVSTSGRRVQVTPHRLMVVMLIREYCHYKESVPVTPRDRTGISLLILSLVQSPDLDLTTICLRISEKIKLSGLVVGWAKGVSRLLEEGVAGVMDLVQSVEKLLTTDNYPVNRSSVIGLLLRQVFLSFDKLTFSEVSSIKQQLDYYFKAGRSALKKLTEHDGDGGESFEMSLESEESKVEYNLHSLLPQEFSSRPQDDEDEDAPACGVSKKQADLFLAQQANLLQSNENAALSPQSLQSEILRILKSCPDLPEAHFLSYLNCLRVKEVAGAVQSLYGSCSQQDDTNTRINMDESSKGFRFAALNLASYHVRMNHKDEAMSAIKEAITMAQEASDHTCLQHVLSLLHRIVDNQDKERLMKRGISKCNELNLTYLTSLSLLSLAAHLTTTSRSEVSHVLELVARSDLINCQHSITELQAASTMVKSTVWSVYGRPGLAVTLAQLLLHQLHHYGESAALAFVNVFMWLDTQGMSAKADVVRRTTEDMFETKSSQWVHIVSEARERILVRRAIARQELSQALTIVQRMKSKEINDASLLEAQVLLKQGHIGECRDVIKKIMATVTDNCELRIRALLLLSDVFNLSGSPSSAVQYLVQAIHLSKENRLDLLYHISILHLANCHLLMGFPGKALSLTMSSLPFLLSHGGTEDCAKAWLLAAKCKIGASKDFPASIRRAEMLEGADMVVKAKDKFNCIGDQTRVQDCLYLLARLYHSLQLTQERNMIASQYKKLEDLHPIKSRITLECLL